MNIEKTQLKTALKIEWSEENESAYLPIVEAWANSLFNEDMIFEAFLNDLDSASAFCDGMQEALWLIVENINYHDTLHFHKVCALSWQRDVCDQVWAKRCERFGVYTDDDDKYGVRAGSELDDMIKAHQAQ